MIKQIVTYYVNCNRHKQEVKGIKVRDDIAYHTINHKKVYTHLPTGMKITEGKLKERGLENKAITLIDENKEKLQERIQEQTINLRKIPTLEEVHHKLEEFLEEFGFYFPYDYLIFGMTGSYVMDINKMELELEKQQGYDEENSMKQNIKNIYGTRAMELCEFFIGGD